MVVQNDFRLSPAMASSELLVLGFVRNFITAHRKSPSYGEISAATGLTPKQVYNKVKRLVASDHLHKVPGPRGLSLPDEVSDAMRLLQAAGFTIDEEAKRLARHLGGTNQGIPLLPPIAHLPESDPGGLHHDTSGADRSRAAAG